jgi:hypothetical protein
MRWKWLGAAALAIGIGIGGWWAAGGPTAKAGEVTIYKSPWCGCCGAWAEHLEQSGFAVRIVEREDLEPIKERYGVPGELGSCHTALVEGYTIEGHVPAADIRRLLAERPAAKGLAVPGMPLGSPGMESGGQRERYQVILFTEDGGQTVFARH